MSGFNSYDQYNSSATNGKQKFVFYGKTTPTMTANLFYSTWALAGIPSAGTFQAAGLNSRSVDSSIQGSIGFGAATVANQRFINRASMGLAASTGPHIGMLVDRLGDLGSTVLAAANGGSYAALTLPRYASAQTTIAANGVSRSGNVVTVTTTAAHGYEVGYLVFPNITGAHSTLTPPANTQVSVTSVPSSTTFTFISASSGTVATDASDGGTVVDCQGVQMFAEVSGTLGATTPTFILTYTNQSGTGGRTTAAVSMGAVTVGCLQTGGFFIPLQGTDSGVRSVESIAITGTTTGNINIVLCRPFDYIPTSAGALVERDMILQSAGPIQCRDNAALQWIYMSGLATAGYMFGSIVATEP